MLDKQGVIAYLKEEGLEFRVIEHTAMYTMEELDASGLFPKGLIAKNLFLRNAQGNRHFLVVLEGSKQVDLKALRTALGTSRLSFASAERLWEHLALKPGSVGPFGVLNNEAKDVEVWFDRDLAGRDVGFHPNDNTATVVLSCEKAAELVRKHGNPFSYLDLPQM